MPGFVISNNGQDLGGNGRSAPATNKYFYSYTWEVEDILVNNSSRRSSQENKDYKSVLVHAKDATLPSFTISKEVVLGGSTEYKYAKSINWDDIRITWYDVKGFHKIMREWRKSVWTRDTGMQPAIKYKRESIISKYFPDDYDDRVTWRCYNSWPSSIKEGDLSYTTSDAKVVEITLTYDWAEESSI